jgi:hypothetical protein
MHVSYKHSAWLDPHLTQEKNAWRRPVTGAPHKWVIVMTWPVAISAPGALLGIGGEER